MTSARIVGRAVRIAALTNSAGGKQDAFVAFLPNSFHTGEKERGKKTEEKQKDLGWLTKADMSWGCCTIATTTAALATFVVVNFLQDGMFGQSVSDQRGSLAING